MRRQGRRGDSYDIPSSLSRTRPEIDISSDNFLEWDLYWNGVQGAKWSRLHAMRGVLAGCTTLCVCWQRRLHSNGHDPMARAQQQKDAVCLFVEVGGARIHVVEVDAETLYGVARGIASADRRQCFLEHGPRGKG